MLRVSSLSPDIKGIDLTSINVRKWSEIGVNNLVVRRWVPTQVRTEMTRTGGNRYSEFVTAGDEREFTADALRVLVTVARTTDGPPPCPLQRHAKWLLPTPAPPVCNIEECSAKGISVHPT